MKRVALLTTMLVALLSHTVFAAVPQAEEGSIANFVLASEAACSFPQLSQLHSTKQV